MHLPCDPHLPHGGQSRGSRDTNGTKSSIQITSDVPVGRAARQRVRRVDGKVIRVSGPL